MVNSQLSLLRDTQSWKVNLLLGALIVASGVLFYFWDLEARKEDLHDRVAGAASGWFLNLERTLDIPRSVASYVALNPEIDQRQLAGYVRATYLSRDLKLLPQSVQLAPNGVVTFEVPWTGGPHIGHDLFKDPARKAEALEAARTRTTVIAGPLTLKQGGRALIARHPIETVQDTESEESSFWGLATILVDWDVLQAALTDIQRDLNTELLVTRTNGAERKVIFPENATAEVTGPPLFSAPFAPGELQFFTVLPRAPTFTFLMLWLFGSLSITTIIKGLQIKGVLERREFQKAADEAAHQERLKLTEELLSQSPAVLLSQSRDWKILTASRAWTETYGYSREETVGHDLIEFMPAASASASKAYRERALRDKSISLPVKNTLQLLTKSGESRTVELHSVARGLEGGWRNFVTIVDITDLVKTHEQLVRLVDHDELSGLLSRRGLMARLENAIGNADYGFFLIDIDHFKSVNDSFGHHVGDQLLRAIGETLPLLAGVDGFAARLGGEEFAILRHWHGWEEAAKFADIARSALQETEIDASGHQVHRTGSIGYARLPQGGEILAALRLADICLREAKSRGRNRAIAADNQTIEELQARGAFITIEEVSNAFRSGSILYHVQPIWNTKTREIAGVEALIRWRRSDGSFIPPDLFVEHLPAVMRDPEIRKITVPLRHDLIAHMASTARDADFQSKYVSFNFSLEEVSFPGAAKKIYEDFGSALGSHSYGVVIEISERSISTRMDTQALAGELQALREYGFRIALDDFGIEASNIHRLLSFPIDIVKLDRSLIENITSDQRQRKVAYSLILMLKGLGVSIVAEGVETETQAQILRGMGNDVHQGFLYHRPMPIEDIEAVIQSALPQSTPFSSAAVTGGEWA